VVASKDSKQLIAYFVNDGEGSSWIGHKETLEAYLLQCKDKALKRSDRAEAAVTFQDTEQNAFERKVSELVMPMSQEAVASACSESVLKSEVGHHCNEVTDTAHGGFSFYLQKVSVFLRLVDLFIELPCQPVARTVFTTSSKSTTSFLVIKMSFFDW
jgi:hypothetical protein